MLQSLFNKVAGLQACSFIKKRLQDWCFPCKYCEIFKNSFFEEYLRMAAFGYSSLNGHKSYMFVMVSFTKRKTFLMTEETDTFQLSDLSLVY